MRDRLFSLRHWHLESLREHNFSAFPPSFLTLLKILKETEAKVNENAIRLALCKKQSELRSARIVELLKETEAKVNEYASRLALCEKESELRSARIVELEKELAALRSVVIPKPVSEAGSDNRS